MPCAQAATRPLSAGKGHGSTSMQPTERTLPQSVASKRKHTGRHSALIGLGGCLSNAALQGAEGGVQISFDFMARLAPRFGSKRSGGTGREEQKMRRRGGVASTATATSTALGMVGNCCGNSYNAGQACIHCLVLPCLPRAIMPLPLYLYLTKLSIIHYEVYWKPSPRYSRRSIVMLMSAVYKL